MTKSPRWNVMGSKKGLGYGRHCTVTSSLDDRTIKIKQNHRQNQNLSMWAARNRVGAHPLHFYLLPPYIRLIPRSTPYPSVHSRISSNSWHADILSNTSSPHLFISHVVFKYNSPPLAAQPKAEI